jgi:hypothetical protein
MGYRDATPEEMDSIFHKNPSTVEVIGQNLPAQTQEVQKSSVPPPKPPVARQSQAGSPNTSSVVSQTNEAFKQLKEGLPAPNAPSAVNELVNQATSNWTKLLPLAIPVLAIGAYKALGGGDGGNKPPTYPEEGGPKSPASRSMSKNMQIDRTVDIPMDSNVQPTIKPDPLAQANQRFADTQKVMAEKGPAPAPAPITQQTTTQAAKPSMGSPLVSAEQTVIGLQGKAGDEFYNTLFGNRPVTPPPPNTPPQSPSTPTLNEAVATGQNPTKAVQTDLATEIRNENFKSYIQKADQLKQPVGSVAPNTRRTAAEMSVVKAERPFNAGFNQFSELVNGKKNPSQMLSAWADLNENLFKGNLPIGTGGKMQFADEVQNFIRANPDKYPDLIKNLEAREAADVARKAKAASQKGGVSPSLALNIAGNAIGAVGLGQAFKQAQKTGDWSDFGLGLAGQILGNIAPRTGIAYGLMAPGQLASGTLDSPEARALGIRPPR